MFATAIITAATATNAGKEIARRGRAAMTAANPASRVRLPRLERGSLCRLFHCAWKSSGGLRVNVRFPPIADIRLAVTLDAMRKLLFFALPAVLLCSCNSNPPSAYKHGRDQFFAVVPGTMFDDDFYPCFRGADGQPTRLSDEECYRFNAPERMRGVWANGFEEGSFYPNRTRPPGETQSDLWLELLWTSTIPKGQERLFNFETGKTNYILLDFVGRRTSVAGSYGHLGLAKHLIIVDRVVSAKKLN